MSIQEPHNPFQSPAAVSNVVDIDQPQEQDDVVRATVIAAIRWSLICGISAVPSWVIAYRATYEVIGGMVTGIIIFVIGYTVLDVRTRKHPLRQRPDVKTTLTITYGTRMAISILFPLGMFADIFCGIVAVGATEWLFNSASFDAPSQGFMPTLVTTLIQGVLLNCVLAGYGLVVYAICRALMGNRSATNTASTW